jgi:hypothetical protein
LAVFRVLLVRFIAGEGLKSVTLNKKDPLVEKGALLYQKTALNDTPKRGVNIIEKPF